MAQIAQGTPPLLFACRMGHLLSHLVSNNIAMATIATVYIVKHPLYF